MLAGQRIAVAGGAGFIGRHLCAALLDAGAHVLCIDNFMTSARRTLAPLQAHDRFTLIEADILELPEFTADGIFNLACPASPPAYQRDPTGTLRINVIGTDNLLRRAKALGARFLQASTSEIYGDPQVHPQRENYLGHVNPIGPRACYDEGKRAAETLCTDYARQYGVDVRIARIFNTYGPGMAPDDGRIISNFVTQALRNQPLTIYGDGSQTRSLCYVDDLVAALLRLYALPDLGAEPINLGNPHEVTVAHLADAIRTLAGSRSTTTHHALPVDDPLQRCPDISRARARLHLQPEIGLTEGLRRTIAHFRAELDLPATPNTPEFADA